LDYENNWFNLNIKGETQLSDEGLKEETPVQQEHGTEELGSNPTPPVKKVTSANGEEVIIEPFHAAILVMMDMRNGSLGIYDLQNCPTRSTAKMLLNEALDHYRSVGTAASTVAMMAEIAKSEPKKKSIINPFSRG
jgi:hypothetical protein